jgi:hypothetical protein
VVPQGRGPAATVLVPVAAGVVAVLAPPVLEPDPVTGGEPAALAGVLLDEPPPQADTAAASAKAQVPAIAKRAMRIRSLF